MRDIVLGLLVFPAIILFAIYVLPWLEIAIYAGALLWLVGGAVLVIGLLLWSYFGLPFKSKQGGKS